MWAGGAACLCSLPVVTKAAVGTRLHTPVTRARGARVVTAHLCMPVCVCAYVLCGCGCTYVCVRVYVFVGP